MCLASEPWTRILLNFVVDLVVILQLDEMVEDNILFWNLLVLRNIHLYTRFVSSFKEQNDNKASRFFMLSAYCMNINGRIEINILMSTWLLLLLMDLLNSFKRAVFFNLKYSMKIYIYIISYDSYGLYHKGYTYQMWYQIRTS